MSACGFRSLYVVKFQFLMIANSFENMFNGGFLTSCLRKLYIFSSRIQLDELFLLSSSSRICDYWEEVVKFSYLESQFCD